MGVTTEWNDSQEDFEILEVFRAPEIVTRLSQLEINRASDLMDAVVNGGILQIVQEYPTYQAALEAACTATDKDESVRARNALRVYCGTAAVFELAMQQGITVPETNDVKRAYNMLVDGGLFTALAGVDVQAMLDIADALDVLDKTLTLPAVRP